jgi:hypothetical protein
MLACTCGYGETCDLGLVSLMSENDLFDHAAGPTLTRRHFLESVRINPTHLAARATQNTREVGHKG